MPHTRRAALIALSAALLTTPSVLSAPAPVIRQVRAFGISASAPPVYVATAAGLYRASSAPYTVWTKRNSVGTIVAISPNPHSPGSLVYYAGNAIYRSTTGGTTANTVASPPGVTALIRPPAAPATIYAAAGTGSEAD